MTLLIECRPTVSEYHSTNKTNSLKHLTGERISYRRLSLRLCLALPLPPERKTALPDVYGHKLTMSQHYFSAFVFEINSWTRTYLPDIKNT